MISATGQLDVAVTTIEQLSIFLWNGTSPGGVFQIRQPYLAAVSAPEIFQSTVLVYESPDLYSTVE